MKKLTLESPDLVGRNIDALAELFPNCVTEAVGADGKVKRAVNFELLRQMLSADAVEGDEHYEFTWVGKRKAIAEAHRPIRKTLRPCPAESKNWDTTENLYIEGDNLEVLKLLQESYLGKVKMIYIDPPYNTGNDFIYRDDFAVTSEEYLEQMGMFDDEDNRLFKNSDSNGRFHSDWCSMMYSRLLLARNLLRHDGSIFISIDRHEADNLKKICDEVFGSDCFISNISWQRTYSTRNDSQGIVTEVEHILVYSKSPEWSPNKLPRTAEMNAKYKNPDNDVAPWRSDNAYAADAITHQGMVYAIQHPFTGKLLYPANGSHWRYNQDEMLRAMRGWCEYELKELDDTHKRATICGVADAEVRKGVKAIVLAESLEVSAAKARIVYERGPWPKFFFSKDGMGGIARKTYLDNVGGKLPTNFWSFNDAGHTDEAKKELKALFDDNAPFDTPKPVRLLDRILTIASDKDSIIMDFFSGSATTAHAVMKKNAEDNGCRKFILVQLAEKSPSPKFDTLCDIGKERIRRAGGKIKSDGPLTTADLDVGFRVFKVDSSNMNDVYYAPGDYTQDLLLQMESNIKSDRSDLDLLFGCLLDWNLPLSLPHSSRSIDGCTVHSYNHGDLMACFDKNVPESVILAIAKEQPLRAVFRDSSFSSSPEKINVYERFKMLAPDTDVRVI